jgi:hypothetical protein
MTVKATFFRTNGGNVAASQVKIRTEEVTLDENSWDCSKTTGKYRNEFLGEGIADTRRKIKDGTYELADLN